METTQVYKFTQKTETEYDNKIGYVYHYLEEKKTRKKLIDCDLLEELFKKDLEVLSSIDLFYTMVEFSFDVSKFNNFFPSIVEIKNVIENNAEALFNAVMKDINNRVLYYKEEIFESRILYVQPKNEISKNLKKGLIKLRHSTQKSLC